MSKSLNSDYLAQLYIKADTKSMDKQLAEPGLASSGLPDEAKALVVYKRGCAQLDPIFSCLRPNINVSEYSSPLEPQLHNVRELTASFTQ